MSMESDILKKLLLKNVNAAVYHIITCHSFFDYYLTCTSSYTVGPDDNPPKSCDGQKSCESIFDCDDTVTSDEEHCYSNIPCYETDSTAPTPAPSIVNVPKIKPPTQCKCCAPPDGLFLPKDCSVLRRCHDPFDCDLKKGEYCYLGILCGSEDSVSPTIQPSEIPSTSPTLSPLTAETAFFQAAGNLSSHYFSYVGYIIIAVASFIGILLVCCLCYIGKSKNGHDVPTQLYKPVSNDEHGDNDSVSSGQRSTNEVQSPLQRKGPTKYAPVSKHEGEVEGSDFDDGEEKFTF